MNPSTSNTSLASSSATTRTLGSTTMASRTPGIARSLRSSALKRDSSTAMLDKEPHPTSSKRALLSSTLTAASTERQLASLQTANHSLTSKLRETEHELASVQRDRRFLADREKAEREAREESEKTRENERKKYVAEIQKLRASLGKMEEQIEEAKDEGRKMKEEAGKTRRELDRKEMESARVKRELETLESELSSTQRDLQQTMEECTELEKRIGKDNEDMIERAAKEIEDRFVKEMEDERKSMEETLEEVLKEKDAEIEDLRATIDEQQKEWMKMEEYAENLESQLTEAATKLANEEKTRTEALALASKAIGRQLSEPSSSPQTAMDVDSLASSSQLVPTQPEPSTPSKTGTLSSMLLATPSSASRMARQAITNRLSSPRHPFTPPFSNSPLRRRAGESSPGPSTLSTPLRIEIFKRDPDAEALGSHLASLMDHLRKVESENVKLRAELGVLRGKDESIQVLKEENMSHQARIKRQEKEIEKLVKASTFSPSLSSSINSSSSPRSVQETNELAKLRVEHANLLERFGEIKAELAGLKSAGRDPLLTQSSGGPEKESEGQFNDDSSDEPEATKQRSSMKERELENLRKELEFAKGMMDSYATELQLMTPNAGLGSASTPLNELNGRRVIQLEQLLEEAKNENEKLREDIETILLEQKPTEDSVTNPDLEVIKQLQSQVLALEETIATRLVTIENLEQELFELRGEIAGGRHVPPNTRILKTTEAAPGDYDPSSSTKSSAPQQNDDLVPKETLMSALREGKRLQEELERREKRLLRLKEIFNSKSAEFREAVGALLGIKLAFYPNGQVRITSLYDMTATFVFSPSKHDLKMQLIGVGTEDGPPQDWRENLPNWQSYWIEQEQCIPGFLATVTLEIYDRWKSKGGGGMKSTQ